MNRQPKPDSKKYTDLISEIEKGQIKIPKFQRDFVWSLDKTAKLLDSILKGYPIGTFILWETKERLNDIKNIGDFKLKPAPDGEKIEYVLDGQQRMTSLYAAYLGGKIQKVGEKKITDYSKIYIDLEKNIEDDEQIVTEEKPKGLYISLHKILNSLKYYDEIEDNFEREMRKKIGGYAQTFSTYDFSTIVLKRDDMDSAIEVFTRINTGGKTLKLFEIMSAKTYDEDQNFDMAERFEILITGLNSKKEKISETTLSSVGYDTISSSVILNILGLILSKNKECKRKTILQLDKQEIIDIWDEVISALKESIDYFRSVYRIPVSAILPYDSLLVPFSYFFYYQKSGIKGNQVKFLEEFFWRMSLSFRYSSSTESKLSQDVKRIDKILAGERPNYDDIRVYLESPRDLIEESFRAGSSYSKAVLCLLSYFEPKDFRNNGKVILDNSWLKIANSKNYHHFFPKSYLRKNNIANANSLVNITLVGADLNKNKIRAKAPSVYIQEFLNENEELGESLKSHLINGMDDFGLLSDDYLIFLEKRSNFMFKELKNRIELNHKINKEEEPIKEFLLRGENEKIEFKSTLRFDLRQSIINKKLEFVIVKSISAFLNAEGGSLIIGVDDNGNILGLEKDFQTFPKKDIDGFELQLRSIIKKYLGNNFEKYLKITFPKIEGKEICMVKILKSGKPVFIKMEGEEKFFVRIGNSSIPKSRQEQSEYEKLHWGI